MKVKILVIDPSGTGTTGIFLVVVENGIIRSYEFQDFQESDWTKHYEFLIDLIKRNKPAIILYENTTYVYGRQQQGTVGLCKLIGSIHGMKNTFAFVEQVGSVPVNSVKSFRDKIQTGTEDIDGLLFQEGRGHGWKYKNKRISKHQVDALIVYYLWTKEYLKTVDEIEEEISQLITKKRLGIRQKEQLEKLEKALANYE